jgi:hypothetical protein
MIRSAALVLGATLALTLAAPAAARAQEATPAPAAHG